MTPGDLDALQVAAIHLDGVRDEFVRKVYLAGLWERINESRQKGMSGRFSTTCLRSWCMCGRIMLTFESEAGDVTWLGPEDYIGSIAFHQENPYFDPATYEYIGLHSLHAQTKHAAAMMRLVIENWPTDIEIQRRIYHDDDKTMLDVVAYARSGREEEAAR
jgi:hypothetical protein